MTAPKDAKPITLGESVRALFEALALLHCATIATPERSKDGAVDTPATPPADQASFDAGVAAERARVRVVATSDEARTRPWFALFVLTADSTHNMPADRLVAMLRAAPHELVPNVETPPADKTASGSTFFH